MFSWQCYGGPYFAGSSGGSNISFNHILIGLIVKVTVEKTQTWL